MWVINSASEIFLDLNAKKMLKCAIMGYICCSSSVCAEIIETGASSAVCTVAV